jgi:hypothetical protein
LACVCSTWLSAQQKDSLKKGMPDYYAKEEVIYEGKRYRIHNTYLTAGGGFLNSSIRPQGQKAIGIDFHFPIRKLHFQMGGVMSGEDFGSNNNVQLHVGYGYRRETRSTNLAAYIGPTVFQGVTGDIGSPPEFYSGAGGYVCLQAVSKFTYDIGVGIELFGEINYKQGMFGFKVIAFFSGAYRGPKRNYNPNVRAENP